MTSKKLLELWMMNDIFEELKQKATVIVDDGWGDIHPEFDEEKFAELIIQECYQAVRSRCDGVLEDEEIMKDQYWKGYVSGVCDAACEIRLWFDSVEFDH